MIEKQQPDIKYLVNEVNDLQSQIVQLRQMNQLNRQVIEVLSSKSATPQLFLRVIQQTCRELEQQSTRISKLLDERNQLNARLLIFQKIFEQNQEAERATLESLLDQIDHLKKQLEQKSQKIKQYEEKIGEVDYLSSLVTKFVNISLPSEQALHFNKQISELNELIIFEREIIERMSKQKEGLLKINLALKNQIEKKQGDIVRIREQSMMMAEYSNIVDQSYEGGERSFMKKGNGGISFAAYTAQQQIQPKGMRDTSMSFLKFQKTIVEEESDSDFDSDNLCPELAVLFPDKIEKIQSNKLAASQVPRLNMMKVRQLMKKNRAKMDNEMKKNAHHNPTEKIIMLENELDYTRRQLSKCILEQKALSLEKQQHASLITELENRNMLLLAGYNKFKQMWQRIHKQYFTYRKLYEECQRYMKTQYGADMNASSQVATNLSHFVEHLEKNLEQSKLKGTAVTEQPSQPTPQQLNMSKLVMSLYSRPVENPTRPKSLECRPVS